MNRLTREEYFLELVDTAALRGTCDRGRAGAVIVKGNRLITTGYVGAPIGLPHCDVHGHEIVKKLRPNDQAHTEHCIRTVHAELNAILQAAKAGVSVYKGQMYCTMFPCYECAKAIVNVGIIHVCSHYDYQDSEKSKEMFNEVGIGFKILGGIKRYDRMGSDKG